MSYFNVAEQLAGSRARASIPKPSAIQCDSRTHNREDAPRIAALVPNSCSALPLTKEPLSHI